MTYSIAARCPRTGMFGVAATTSSIGVGGRCLYARANIGAVLTQSAGAHEGRVELVKHAGSQEPEPYDETSVSSGSGTS